MDKWDVRFMDLTETIAKWSSCYAPGRQIGAVIVKDKRIMTTGYNGAPAGMRTCVEKQECLRRKMNIASGTRAEICYAAHAEQNAILQAAKLGISSLLNKIPPECSGGQKQRAAICRALINNPGLIVADEPTGALDSENSEELMELFEKMNRESGSTIVMVTHDSFVASFTSRLIFIRDGAISQEISREGMDQDTYFRKIVEISSSNRTRRKTA